MAFPAYRSVCRGFKQWIVKGKKTLLNEKLLWLIHFRTPCHLSNKSSVSVCIVSNVRINQNKKIKKKRTPCHSNNILGSRCFNDLRFGKINAKST